MYSVNNLPPFRGIVIILTEFIHAMQTTNNNLQNNIALQKNEGKMKNTTTFFFRKLIIFKY